MPNFTFFSQLKKPKQDDCSIALYPVLETNMNSAHSRFNGAYRAENYNEAVAPHGDNPSIVSSAASHQLSKPPNLPSRDNCQIKASSTFPTELLARPQKSTSRLRLRKRSVAENAAPKTLLDDSLASLLPKSSSSVSGFAAAVAEETTNHMFARQTTSRPVSSHAFPTPSNEDTVAHIPDGFLRFVLQQPSQPVKRKPVAVPVVGSGASKDPLVERFGELDAKNPLSPSITLPSAFATFHDQSLDIAGVDLETMTKNNPTSLPTEKGRQADQIPQKTNAPRRKKSTRLTQVGNEESEQVPPISTRSARKAHRRQKFPGFVDLEEDDNSRADSERPTTNFSNVNCFQKQTRYHTPPRQRRSRLASPTQSNIRRSRSSSSSSDGLLTPESSGSVSRSIDIQEEQDRQLALRLQQEEERGYDQRRPSFCTQLQSAIQGTSSSRPAKSSRTSSSRSFPNRGRSYAYRGTREDPVDLDSDFNSDVDKGNDSYTDYVASATNPRRGSSLHVHCGEPMDLDDLEPGTDIDSSDNERVFQDRAQSELRDAEMARALQEEEDERHRQTRPNTRECAVCSDSIAIAELPSLASCSHPPQTCGSCYGSWITAQLRESSWRVVKCPASSCKVTLTYHEMQQYAPPTIFSQYDMFSARAVFSSDPNFRWCRAEGCQSGQIHDGGQEGNIFTCCACGVKVCIVHEGDGWHEGETCEEFEYRRSGRKERDQREQEEASLKAVGASSKKCPGPGCVYNIEKNEGCDHMTCSKCGYEFCWLCLCDYNAVRTKGNSAHANHCKYHARRF